MFYVVLVKLNFYYNFYNYFKTGLKLLKMYSKNNYTWIYS